LILLLGKKFFVKKQLIYNEAPFVCGQLAGVVKKKEEKCGGRAPWDQILVKRPHTLQFQASKQAQYYCTGCTAARPSVVAHCACETTQD